jgi:hypothetical protein
MKLLCEHVDSFFEFFKVHSVLRRLLLLVQVAQLYLTDSARLQELMAWLLHPDRVDAWHSSPAGERVANNNAAAAAQQQQLRASEQGQRQQGARRRRGRAS